MWLTHVSKSYFYHTATLELGGLTTVEIMDEVTIPMGDISAYDVLGLKEKVIIPQMVGVSMCAHHPCDVIGS